MMNDKVLGVGLVGLGFASNPHEMGYTDLPDLCRIAAMCDVKEDLARDRAQVCGATAYTNYQELLNDPKVDVVDITTQHESHYEIAKAAIEKGKHVFVEKPICVRSQQGKELVQLAQQAGVRLGVAENTPFVKAYIEVEKLLEQGILGDIWFVRTMIAGESLMDLADPQHWLGTLPYGGVILDSSVHSFYLYKWLFGGALDTLGFASRFSNTKPAEENGLVLGHLANGAEYELFTTVVGGIPWMERVEIYGSKGGMIIDQLANPVLKYYLGSSDMDGTVVGGVEFDPLAWKFNSMVAEVKDYVQALVEGRPSRVEPMDAVFCVECVEAVERSVKVKRAVKIVDKDAT
jgi:UDP-N-acetyl-2-amino-2-deoxyglucuronate dehydrogenase